MKYIITGRGITVTEGLKAAVIEKISKLERYVHADTEALITLSVEKDRQKIEITIPVKGSIIRAEQVSNDMYVSIDLVEETLERQLKKYKRKIVDRQQAGEGLIPELFEDDNSEDADAVKIVRTKRFGIKPMDPDSATQPPKK